MQTVFITGANRGIGLEFAAEYAAAGWEVIACCRNPDAAHELKAVSNIKKIYKLDVEKVADIQQLKSDFTNQAIDVLINNAGLMGPENQTFGHTDPKLFMQILAINTMAPLLIAEVLLPSILQGKDKIIANISSTMGSIQENTSGGHYAYRASKAALNAVTKSMAIDLASKNIKVISLHPGWVKTAMGGPDAMITPHESVSGMIKIISDLTLSDSGKFLRYANGELPW